LSRVPDVIEPGVEFTVFLREQDWGSAGIAIRGTADSEQTLRRTLKLGPGGLQRRDLLFSKRCGIVEAGKDVPALERWVRAEERINGIAIGQHAEDLMHRDAGAPHASLAVADFWVNSDAFLHGL
jgi:hypothetical protein